MSTLVQSALISPAIYYRSDGFDTSQDKLIGRQAAGESFLKALSQHSPFERLTCYALTRAEAKRFERQVHTFSAAQKETHWIQPSNFQTLSEPGCLFIPGPNLEPFAWQRRHTNQSAFSLCGITHTTASESAMSNIGALLTAPIQPWDALICTSYSVRQMVQTLLGNYQEYLCERLNTQAAPVQFHLPVIPLGVDAEQFSATEHKQQMGKVLRAKFEIAEDTIVFLFVGRISFHAKAHPYPMFLALEQAAQRTGKKLCLILAGWYANNNIQERFQEAARLLCPSVTLLELDGRKSVIRECIWYAADVFTSFSENIQETFGLTPIEAKAAGLPVVVSDWDGYRETVRHGIDGFLIPTAMPMPGCGEAMALRYAMDVDDYDHYIGNVSQSTAFSIEAATQAYTTLIEHPELRIQMGQNAQADVLARFDWPVIMQAYQSLWAELAEMRKTEQERVPVKAGAPANPLRDDPYRSFQHYPSTLLTPQTRVALDDLSRRAFIEPLAMNQVGHALRLTGSQVHAVLAVLAESPGMTLESLQAAFPTFELGVFYRTMGWLLKMGLIQNI
jgi:starch synthase